VRGSFIGHGELWPDQGKLKHWWSQRPYKFTNNEVDPLTFLSSDGAQYQPDRHFSSDGGSIPIFIQAIPAFQHDRYFRSYLFHDSACIHKCVFVKYDILFIKQDISRHEANFMLRDMLLAEGATMVTAQMVLAAVEMYAHAMRIE